MNADAKIPAVLGPAPAATAEPPAADVAGQRGFVKWVRSGLTDQLLADPKAFHLLAVIAYRARWQRDASIVNNLQFGQARIGDCASYGMTRKEERWARERLVKYGLATFETSRRGTIASLTGNKVFEVGPPTKVNLDLTLTKTPEKGHQETPSKGQLFLEVKPEDGAIIGTDEGPSEGPSEGHQGASKKKGKKQRIEETEAPPLPFASDAFREAWDLFAQHRREIRKPLTATATKLQFEELAKIGEVRAIAAIRFTIKKGWQGIREPEAPASWRDPAGQPNARPDPRDAFPVKYARET